MTGVTVQPSGAMSKRVSASMMTLVLVALCLRTWSRLKTHWHFLVEDLLILLAAALFYAEQGLYLYGGWGFRFRLAACHGPALTYVSCDGKWGFRCRRDRLDDLDSVKSIYESKSLNPFAGDRIVLVDNWDSIYSRKKYSL